MSTAASRPASRWRPLAAVAALTLLADQASKVWALQALADGRPRDVLGQWFSLQLIANSGAAFSIGSGRTWVLTLVAVVIGCFVVAQARRIVNLAWAVCIGLVMGGLLGNLADRLFRPPSFGQGHVVDFLNYHGWFIGNVADIAIVGAACAMVLLSVRGVPYDAVPQAGGVTAAASGEHAAAAADEPEPARVREVVEDGADSSDNGRHA